MQRPMLRQSPPRRTPRRIFGRPHAIARKISLVQTHDFRLRDLDQPRAIFRHGLLGFAADEGLQMV